MKIKEVMSRDVVVVRPDTSVADAAAQMKTHDAGPLPVCEGDRLIGMVTDRDLTPLATDEGLDPRSTRVQDVMTPEVLFCFEEQEVREAARLMQQKNVRQLLVLNRASRLVGMVSLGDLAPSSGD
jgi:CBS domain-containing protein